MFFCELETRRLFLKNISSEDRDFIYEQFSNDKVSEYLFDAEPPSDILGADQIIDIFIQPEPRPHHRWILVRKEDGVKLGTCGFHCWYKSSCDVGYDLYPVFWGKGYMSEAMKAILTFARNDMKVKHINACIYINNENSIKLAEKFGFTYKGQMKDEILHGEIYPHKIFTLDC